MASTSVVVAVVLLVGLIAFGTAQTYLPHSTLAAAVVKEPPKDQQQLNLCMNECMRNCVHAPGDETGCLSGCRATCGAE